jgi:hypothetical protein
MPKMSKYGFLDLHLRHEFVSRFFFKSCPWSTGIGLLTKGVLVVFCLRNSTSKPRSFVIFNGLME